jgi:hypothetical protein
MCDAATPRLSSRSRYTSAWTPMAAALLKAAAMRAPTVRYRSRLFSVMRTLTAITGTPHRRARKKKFGHHSDSTWMTAVGRTRARASSTHGARSIGK